MEGAEPRRLVPSASQVSGVRTGPEGQWINLDGSIILSIGIVSNPVAVGIHRFGGIQGKGICGIRNAVAVAVDIAREGRIITFGISPDRPETGFGYIKAGEPIGPSAFTVASFREKPDQATAMTYLADDTYSWNAGIFLFPASLMQAELRAHAPDVMESAAAALDASDLSDAIVRIDETKFSAIRSISIDYAVMEHTLKAAIVGPVSCAWSDVGTWPAWGELQENASASEPVLIDTKNCTVHTDDDTLVAALGVEDLVIAAHRGTVLVMNKSRAQDVNLVLEALKARGRSDLF